MRSTRNRHWPPSGGRCRCWAGAAQAQGGFTIVELVVVMMLMAVITGVGMARFANREPFAVQGAADQVVSGLRLAQATAIAQRQTVYVLLGATPAALQVCLDVACTQALPAPGGEAPWLVDAQGLVLSAGAAFSFAPDGAPSFGSQLSLQVQSADGSATSNPIRVEPGSGHVHSP